jgi:hypothetical protein
VAEVVAAEAEVRIHPAVVVAVVGEGAELHIFPMVAVEADMNKPELAHIAVEVAVAAREAGNQRWQ